MDLYNFLSVYLRQRYRNSLKECIHDQHGGDVHHDFGLIVHNVDIVGEKADEEKKNRRDVDRDNLIVVESSKHDCELGIVGPGIGRSVDDLKLIKQKGSNIGNIFRDKLYQVCNRIRDSQIYVTFLYVKRVEPQIKVASKLFSKCAAVLQFI